MQNQFHPPANPEGSLKIYQPPGHTISNTFFVSEHQTYVSANPRVRPYVRQESIIDRLGNKDETSQDSSNGQEKASSNNIVSPRPTSIEFLVDAPDTKTINLKQEGMKIQDIFANRPALSSKQFNSSILKSLNGPLFQQKAANPDTNLQERSKNSNSHIVLPSFPSKEYMPDSPERPNLNRPFLRKKTSSVRNSEVVDPTPPPAGQAARKDEQPSFELNKLETAIKHLKQYNNELLTVYKTLQVLEQDQGNTEWRSLGKKQMQLLKLMVEKAIISKEEYH